jgi:hypothetical protein
MNDAKTRIAQNLPTELGDGPDNLVFGIVSLGHAGAKQNSNRNAFYQGRAEAHWLNS